MHRPICPRFLLAALVAAVPATSLAENHLVRLMSNNTFSPSDITIQIDDTVTFRNDGGFHNVEADDGSFRCAQGCDGSGGNGDPSGDAWSVTITFDEPGLVRYFCQVHGNRNGVGMSGRITVEDDAPDPPGPPEELPTDFSSGFEVEGFIDWDGRVCPSCNELVGQLEEGTIARPQSMWRETGRRGRHAAVLHGPREADFDLHLLWWNGSGWSVVASSISPGSDEELVYMGDPGRYLWEVRSVTGAGSYHLIFDDPELQNGEVNQLRQTGEASKQGDLGLDSVYVAKKNNRDYLIRNLPAEVLFHRVAFWIKPAEELFIKGKKHEILRLSGTGGKLVRVYLWPPEEEDGLPRLVARVQMGNGKLSEPLSLDLVRDKWTRVRFEWTAASGPGAADGSLLFFKGSRKVDELTGLDNPDHRVRQVFFGQITKGRRKTVGSVFFDRYDAAWDF